MAMVILLSRLIFAYTTNRHVLFYSYTYLVYKVFSRPIFYCQRAVISDIKTHSAISPLYENYSIYATSCW